MQEKVRNLDFHILCKDLEGEVPPKVHNKVRNILDLDHPIIRVLVMVMGIHPIIRVLVMIMGIHPIIRVLVMIMGMGMIVIHLH
jgi:nitrate reductase NapE component